jgi:enoyl-CoA hydratase/carnithine racemase
MFTNAMKHGGMSSIMKDSEKGADNMVNMLMSMAKSNKPIISVVRGKAMGISFTLLAHSTFIYTSPDA